MLNTLAQKLYDIYLLLTTAKEVWIALNGKYKHVKIGTDRFLIVKYFEYKFDEKLGLLDQVRYLEILSSCLRAIGVVIPHVIQITAILSKLLTSWKGYRKKMLHSKEVFSYDDFTSSLQIECENCTRDVETDDLVNKVHHVSLG
ncbi:hypothetical protein LIER_19732 [Lithospermum erythrorhizon]|uniref:Uncharacterized protein n=1 Tax=Lithospermum erythrorhizon TaxID=34254 RepID=A0AAV3QPC6_LITER